MLYVCATPIGNLKDISFRAIEILTIADIILCEDKRTSQILLNHYNITQAKLIALHEHNEEIITIQVLKWLSDDKKIVQICDAGTPSISDPGAKLCDAVRDAGFIVSILPGACAYIALLSVAGLSCPHLFCGFLPSTQNKRINKLKQWVHSEYAVILYEAPHRIISCLEDIISCHGSQRVIIMGRELTKKFETIKKLPAQDLLHFIQNDNNQSRGEFILIITPCINIKDNQLTNEQQQLLTILHHELPPKKAISITQQIFAGDKTIMYDYILKIKNE